MPHGSDVHRDGRWYQIQAVNTHDYETQSPKTALLFQGNVADMHEEFVRLGVQFLGEEDRYVQVWNHLKATQLFEKKDRRCCFARFLSSVAKPQECLKSWAQDRFHRTHLGIECDPLRGKKFQAAVTLTPVSSADQHGHTSGKVLDIVDKSIRYSCANAVSVSVMMLSNDENKGFATSSLLQLVSSSIGKVMPTTL